MFSIPMMMRTITVNDVQFPQEFKTNRDLLTFANLIIRPPPSKPVEFFMICDIIQCLLTFIACANVMVKKGRMQDVRLVTLRKSPYGTFIVPNAVWTLLSGVVIYLLTWMGFCSWILFVQETDRPIAEWVWFIPFPWLVLSCAGFAAAYGFVLTCSPRSPISNLSSGKKRGSGGNGLSWYHLPIPHSALLMNTLLISIIVAMLVYNAVATGIAGRQLGRTHEPGRNIVAEFFSQPFTHSQEWLNAAPTEATLKMVKISWVDLANVYRNCCVAIASYLVLTTLIIAMGVLYSIPNQLFLMDHLCRIFPDAPEEKCTRKRSAWENVVMLWKMGLPRNLKGPSYSAFRKTWMMTMIGHSQSILLLAAVAAFTVPPWYLFFVPWENLYAGKSSDHQVMFIVAYTITVAFLSAGWVTGLSATLTYDDIFKAVSGLGNGHISDEQVTSSSQTSSTPWQTRTILRKFPGANLTLLPTSQTRSKSVRSPTSVQSPGLLRPMPSFAPSSADSHNEKGTIQLEEDPLASRVSANKVTVVTETTVTVHHSDLEANLSEFNSIPMYPHPYNPTGSPTRATSPYHFLGRNANRQSS